VKLPEIDYANPVQGTAQTAAMPYEAAAGASKVISDGLRAYSQEIIKTQQQEAAVKVSEGLQAAELAIKARKYVSAKEVRDTFGDQVPAHVAERLQVQDPATGQMVDNQQIPMWAVGDSLYAHAAKRTTEAAAKGIDGIGWQSDFKGQIANHVVSRQGAMASYQLDALDKYLQQTQLQQIDRLVNARDFGGAAAALGNSQALPPELRQKVGSAIEAARQESPANDALTSNDPAVIKAQADRLKTDPAALEAIPEAKRASLISTLENRARIFEGQAIATTLTSDRKLLNPDGTVNLGRAQARIDATVKDPLLAAQAMDATHRRAAYIQQGQADQVNTSSAQAIQAFTMLGPDGKPQNSVAAVQLLAPKAWAYLTSSASGIKGAEIVRTLEGWDEAAKARTRGERMQPTPDQAKKAIEIEAWLYGSPGEVKAMPVEAFADMWMRRDAATGEPLLSQADYQRLGNLYAQIHGKPLEQFYLENPKAIVIDEMKSAFPRLKRPEAKWGDLETRVYNTVAARAELQFAGQKPDPAKLRAFVQGEIAKVSVPGFFGSSDVPKVQAEVQGRMPLAPAHAPPPPASKVTVIGPKGQTGTADAAGIDSWLQQHPGWRKQ
jgi:hypothetical protein